MVYVPGGTFEMGSMEGKDNEQPPHSVSLDGFWIDRTEVSNAQYQRCVQAGTCQAATVCEWGTSTFEDPSKADYPVACVDWHDAQRYCEWVEGLLPTEAEWEYASRGDDGRTYPWGDDPPTCKRAHFVECSESAGPVDSLPDGASWSGALGMAGNVWEWVADWYADYPSEPQINPKGPDEGNFKPVRGGDWFSSAYQIRATFRHADLAPINQGNNIGFRCVGSPGE
jgi:formylglycine-generating enzyme required for sulfatase activity